MAGDRLKLDIAPAQQAGIFAVRVKRYAEEFWTEDGKPNAEVGNLAELLELLPRA